MKKTLLFLLNILFLSLLMAQTADETAKREMERTVKTTGDYFWAEAVESTLEQALNAATSTLTTEINQEIGSKMGKTVSAAAVKQHAEFIDLMRGNKYRAIAYIKKNQAEFLFEKKNHEESRDVSKKEVTIADVQEGVFAEAENIEKTATEKKEEPQEVNEVDVVDEMETVADVEEEVKNEKKYYYDHNDLLGQIVKAPSAREVNKLLADNKKSGKTVYGTMETLTSPESVYMVVYKKTGEIVAILDKGSQNLRRDLISGEMKNKDIYKDNQVVWFQIY